LLKQLENDQPVVAETIVLSTQLMIN